jgi:DNA-binding NtrC family response regulator
MPKKVDIRLHLGNQSSDLIAAIKAGRFREDLFYRLNVFPIHGSAAAQARRTDIPLLVAPLHRAICYRHRRESAASRASASRHAMALALLQAHDWPGNIRQLQNAIHRAIVLCDGDTLTADLFPQIAAQIPGYKLDGLEAGDEAQSISLPAPQGPGLTQQRQADDADPVADPVPSEPSFPVDTGMPAVNAVTPEGEVRRLAEVEEELIRFALSFYRGQMSEVARRLGIGRSTLYRKLKDYAINPDDPDQEAA